MGIEMQSPRQPCLFDKVITSALTSCMTSEIVFFNRASNVSTFRERTVYNKLGKLSLVIIVFIVFFSSRITSYRSEVIGSRESAARTGRKRFHYTAA